MKYTKYKELIEACKNSASHVDGQAYNNIISAVAQGDFGKLVDIKGGTITSFCKLYNIPFRSTQNWIRGERKAPDYLIELIGYSMIMEGKKMGLKRILTEKYDCWHHEEVEPYGVQDYPLIDGKLFFSDDYEWILIDNFGIEISTECGYDEGDLGRFPEKTLELIHYLVEDAPKRGYIEDAEEKDAERICRLLGEDYE